VKTGLILEGGAMRGMFTAGVTDVMMEEGIDFDGMIGVSAGASFGCNYKSRQIGRTIRYNVRFCREPEFCSFRSLLKTGDLYGGDFCYNKLPHVLDPFDAETFEKNPMEFYVVCTDVETGKAVYHKCRTGGDEDLQWMRASASMPIASKPVELDGKKLLDGGIADSIPVRFFEHIGYEKNVIILTQPAGYVKQQQKYLPVLKVFLRDYPAVWKRLVRRHIKYNKTLKYISQLEREGKAFVVRPPVPLEIGSTEHNAKRLLDVYRIGRETAESMMSGMKAFLDENREETLWRSDQDSRKVKGRKPAEGSS
jgi:predicted patatin/cPLA2 family phospholipase